ncbi:hypothetical protein [Pseudomonas oryzihabitans]|uniref:hypothetical protein n=1 Tax=Pseudomonas oryzihabitans TaxID=47885 RepID=UPI002893DEBE|nr:hypothetical protein [Pseudomonas oryzihabitans]MDT3720323.1 hypothetical protein [Pseudomonas oryzihabitans]
MKATDTADFLNSLNAGVFAQQVGRALSDVAAGVVDQGKAGQVVLSFKFKRIGESNQVTVSHTLDYIQPTKRGKLREDLTLDTPMYSTADGVVLFQTNPTDQLFNKDQAPVKARD